MAVAAIPEAAAAAMSPVPVAAWAGIESLGAAAALTSGDVLRSPLSGGGGAGDAQDRGGRAGSTIIVTARRIVIGAAGLITSTGASGDRHRGQRRRRCPMPIRRRTRHERATGYVANAGATGGNNGSEGIREVYYRSASPPVIEADWHTGPPLARRAPGVDRAVK